MNSIEYRKELDLIKGRVIQDCKEALESIALRKYSLEKGYKHIIMTFPLWDQEINTPIYINSCFQGEDNILIRSINCSSDGISVGCHYIGEGHNWKANIAEVCMHERDMVNILDLIERMKGMENVFDFLHIKY